nr:MAG TPA: hypothetical protein [Caudoviricetes sp.]
MGFMGCGDSGSPLRALFQVDVQSVLFHLTI